MVKAAKAGRVVKARIDEVFYATPSNGQSIYIISKLPFDPSVESSPPSPPIEVLAPLPKTPATTTVEIHLQ